MNDVHSSLAPYALHALDSDEEREFERHLTTCDRCRRELAGLREAAAALAYAPEGPAPPPQLRERILEQARAERPNVVPLRPRRPPAWTVVAATATLAAAAVIALAVWGIHVSNQLDSERSARSADARALAIVADPTARRSPLVGRGRGTLVVAGDGAAALVIRRLARTSKDKTYEAWVIRGSTPRAAGLFRGGGDATIVALDRPVPANGTVAVTVERAAGADRPTTKPILAAKA